VRTMLAVFVEVMAKLKSESIEIR